MARIASKKAKIKTYNSKFKSFLKFVPLIPLQKIIRKLSFWQKPESRKGGGDIVANSTQHHRWIPAFAGMTVCSLFPFRGKPEWK